MHGRRQSGGGRATRAAIALVAAVACLGGVALAATSHHDRAKPKGGKDGDKGKRQGHRPPRPSFIEVPADGSPSRDVQFRFHVPPPQRSAGRGGTPTPAPAAEPEARQFQCRLDAGSWRGCSSPRRLRNLNPGEHAFAVRVLSPKGRPGRAAHYRWAQTEPKQLAIEPLVDGLETLMPGAPAQPLPVRIANPNPVPVEVTGLTVAATPDAPGCAADPNFAVVPSNLSPAAPLTLPPGGSVVLPSGAATAPTLAMRELASDQNACQGASVQLVFSAEARG